VKAICHLYRVRRSGADRSTVICRAITGDHFNARMLLKPDRGGFGNPIGKEVDNLVALAVSKDGAENLALAKGNVVATKHARRWKDGKSGGVRTPEERVSAGREGASRTQASSSRTTKGQG